MEAITQLKKFIGHHFNLKSFHRYMINNDNSYIETLIKFCQLDNTGQRFNLWRLFFNIYSLEDTVYEKINKLNKTRETCKQLEQKYQRSQDVSLTTKIEHQPKKGPLGGPLGGGSKIKTSTQNPMDEAELRNEIRKDIERTYQEIQFFANKKVLQILTNVLFICSKENNEISFRQGMNEVAASLIHVYFQEALYSDEIDKLEGATEEDKQILLEFNSWEYAEADIYTLFQKLMNDAQHVEMFRPNYTEAQKIKLQSKKRSAILTRVSKIQDVLLKQVEMPLFRHLKLLQVEFQIFLLKWIRCIFTRELHLIESFKAWDAIFYDFYLQKTETLFFVDYLAIAMIIYVEQPIMEMEDSSQCYQRFLKYPQVSNLSALLECANHIRAILLNQKSATNLDDQNESNQSTIYQDKQFTPIFSLKQQIKLMEWKLRQQKLLLKNLNLE